VDLEHVALATKATLAALLTLDQAER
jgi:hypothetical protein